MESFEWVSLDSEEDIHGQAEVFDCIMAFSKSMALKNAIDLGIADVIAHQGPNAWLSLDEIAHAVSAKNTDFLFRLMRFLVRINIFSENNSKYGLTRSSKWLIQNGSKHCLAPLASFILDKSIQEPWHHLQECITQGGEDSFSKANNGKSIFDTAGLNPRLNNMINNAMVSDSTICISSVLQHYHGFQDIETLVDVGGGVGLTLSLIKAAYPNIKCINFDLPHVLASAQRSTEILHVGGDMFESIPQGDAILMKWTLHDWNDDKCVEILKKCHSALPANGKLIIIEAVLRENDGEEHEGASRGAFNDVNAAFDLLMAALAPSGRERNETEWTCMLAKGGFPRLNVHNIRNLQSVIEAFKA